MRRAGWPFFFKWRSVKVSEAFDPNCRRCPRLVEYRARVRNRFPGYHSAPVPGFGSGRPKLLIVGLAPGLHGANRSGRPFTGDASGNMLFQMLHEFGFSSSRDSIGCGDGLILTECRVTNAVLCLPPQNRPLAQEINCCASFLAREIESLVSEGVILALGHLAHTAVLRVMRAAPKSFVFKHHRVHNLASGNFLVDSYHCSRYNLSTRRLTHEMFRGVFRTVRGLIQ